MSDLFNTAHATFSACGKYRYALRRRWNSGASKICTFIMLNPSTADETNDDPTVRRCIGFAQKWNYDALLVLNLFAFISSNPQEMLAASDPIGPENDRHLLDAAGDATAFGNRIVCAWGSFKGITQRVASVRKLLADGNFSALKLSKHGNPWHPLYVPANQQLIAFSLGVKS